MLPPLVSAASGSGWEKDILDTGVFCNALVLTLWNLANSQTDCQKQSNENASWDDYIPLHLRLYIFIGVGLSALLVLTIRAMREPQRVEPSNKNRLHVLFLYAIMNNHRSVLELAGIMKKNTNTMKAIEENPYRIIGVFSNSPTKEKVANMNKLKAFIKVGKNVSFPLDLDGILSTITRTEERITAANSKLTLPADQLKYAQFWFLKDGPLDDVAFNHLFAGDMAKAVDIWSKKDSVSSLQNRVVCALIKEDYSTACSCAEKLYSQFADSFVSMVAGDTVKGGELGFEFLDGLAAEVGASNLLPHITNNTWRQHLNSAAVAPVIESLQAAIETAKASRGKGSTARYNAGLKLMNGTKSLLTQLNQLLPKSDMQYQMVVDKLANEILQCGIDYFNDSEEDNAPDKAMTLQSYAQSIAVGQMTKDRCKENVDILKKIGPEYKVQKEMNRLAELLKRFNAEPSMFDRSASLISEISGRHNLWDIENFIDKCKPDLMSIKQKLGAYNDLYIKISSAVASSAINALVDNINKAQALAQFSSDKSSIRSSISSAVSIMSKISSLDMSSQCRSYFNNNNATLNRINSQLTPSSSGGCYIATMAYGDYDHPQVMVLRQFRDDYLDKRDWGKQFIKYYYAHSPIWVEHLKDHKLINRSIRKVLDFFVFFLKKCY